MSFFMNDLKRKPLVTPSSCLGRLTGFCFIRSKPILAIATVATLVSGCTGGGGGGTGTALSGSTKVVLLASSIANDQLAAFETTLESLTLTSQSGKQVTVLASPVGDEFIHLNGHVEPLVTVSVPQDVYVSAAVTDNGGGSSYCAGHDSGVPFHDELPSGENSIVNLPNPVTVTGAAMGLVLNLQVASLPGGCPSPAQYAFAPPVTAAFNLTPMAFAAQPTNSSNGMAPGLQGLISSVDAGGTGFTVSALVNGAEVLDPPTWHAVVNGNTVFQAVAGASQLSAGLPVDMDLAIQSDGSLLATRVAVISTDTTTLTVANGTPLNVVTSAPIADISGPAQEGYLPLGEGGFGPVNFGSANFQISGQLGNLAALPFTASFDAANIVPGQNLTLTTQAAAFAGGPNYTPVTTMTLRPQTINGTVSAVSTSGSFTTYTVTLASYDIFPQFATQPGQTTLLPNPNTVIVYADSNTQMLNSDAIAAGGVFRFYGLIFNDNGTLRMDCAQVSNGVAE